jgi:hypothetical protein
MLIIKKENHNVDTELYCCQYNNFAHKASASKSCAKPPPPPPCVYQNFIIFTCLCFASPGNYGHKHKRGKHPPHLEDDDGDSIETSSVDDIPTKKINQQPTRGTKNYDPNRYAWYCKSHKNINRVYFFLQVPVAFQTRDGWGNSTEKEIVNVAIRDVARGLCWVSESDEFLLFLPQTALEVNIDEIYKPGSVLDMPQRPMWDYKMSKEKLLTQEEQYFRVSFS